jgi:hypothetical protein
MVFASKLTSQQIEQVVLLHKKGRTQAEIGKMLNVSHMTIGRVLRRQGIVISPIRKSLPTDVSALAYLAGLFDGEGSINIFKQPGQKERITPRHFLEISIGNTHKGVLRWVLENFGGRLTHNGIQYTLRSHKTWRWRASTKEASDILVAILPYLRIKKEQALLAVEFQERLIAFNASQHNPITPEEIDWREQQRVKLSTMRFWKDEEEE